MKMKLKSIFQKKIDRDIKGVIKVGYSDEVNIKQELEEFIVTDEIKVNMDKFFKEYGKSLNGATDNNGVWISGFFGSGKSHFLKILSYILKNENICEKNVISYFKGKGLKRSTLDNMKKVETISSDIILFNVASKIEQSKEQESLVTVFNGAFNEMRSLCGSKPWVAAMEEKLIAEGIYEDFKQSFKEEANKDWSVGRESFYFEKDSIIKALIDSAKISKEAAQKWCEKSEETFNLTVENFAERVSQYCAAKGENHHVIFFVDEIGQYIGQDTRLMLNLQTIIEELAVKCQGNCWVVVTAQEELTSFIKEESEDFSKILGRFKTKISLTSSNADEVIKRRLLKKNKKAALYLKDYYEKNEGNLKELSRFSVEGGLKGYKDGDDFVDTYPFVGFQFHILQLLLNRIRENGVAGSHISKGERSLLEFYQNTLINYMDHQVGAIIPLEAFYDELENHLNSSIKSVIREGENQLGTDEFSLRVLKTLFFLKYLEDVEGNMDNICILLMNSLCTCQKGMREKTQASLEILVKEGLVEKRRNEYVFLTKEEQLINREIDNIPIEKEEVNDKLGEIIFHKIYKDTRFNYSSQYRFSFNRYVDNRIIGAKRSEVGIRFITSLYEIKGDKLSELKTLTEKEKEVIVDLSENLGCVEQTERLLKIDAYLRKNHGLKSSKVVEGINERKVEERDLICKDIEEALREALKKAKIYVSSNYLQQGEKNGVDKINEGMLALINTEYFKLNYVKFFRSEVEELTKIIYEDIAQDEIVTSAGELALQEVRAFIEGSYSRGGALNLNDILKRFSKMPYGWRQLDIQGILLELLKSNDIKGAIGENFVKDDKNHIYQCIINNTSQEEIFFKPRVRINSKHLEAAKQIGKDLFNIILSSNDSEEIMYQLTDLFKAEANEINHMLYEGNRNKLYPGRQIIELGHEIFKDILCQKAEQKFYKEIYELQYELEEYIDAIEEIKGFYFKKNCGKVNVLERGEQRIIFDEGIEVFSNFKEDEPFIQDEELKAIMADLQEIIFNKRPYSLINKIPQLLSKYHMKFTPLVQAEIHRLVEVCEKVNMEIVNGFEDNELKGEVVKTYEELRQRISAETTLMKLAALEKLVERKSDFFTKKLTK